MCFYDNVLDGWQYILAIAEYLKNHPPTIRGYGKIYVDIQQRWVCLKMLG